MTKIKKIIAGVTALACAGVIGVGMATEGFQTWTPTVEQNAPVSNGGMVAGNLFGKGMFLSMVKASAAEADTVTVTATLTTAGSGYNDDLAWSPAFKTTSGWASGKTVTDYVTVTPASDTHSITVTCKQAFGTPIVITATSVDNPDVKATCQLDYVKRIDSMQMTLDQNCISFTDESSYSGSFTFGVGTITPTVTITDVSVYDDSGDSERDDVAEIAGVSVDDIMDGGVNIITEHNESVSGTNFSGTFSIAYENRFGKQLTTEQIRQLYNLLAQEKYVHSLWLDVGLTVSYNGINYGGRYDSTYRDVNYDGIQLNTVTGVSLDKTTFIF